jgi:hypothetical protein
VALFFTADNRAGTKTAGAVAVGGGGVGGRGAAAEAASVIARARSATISAKLGGDDDDPIVIPPPAVVGPSLALVPLPSPSPRCPRVLITNSVIDKEAAIVPFFCRVP